MYETSQQLDYYYVEMYIFTCSVASRSIIVGVSVYKGDEKIIYDMCVFIL
ncbi:hypothetical protein ACSS6W_007351 [Trichoderma asperelloides]